MDGAVACKSKRHEEGAAPLWACRGKGQSEGSKVVRAKCIDDLRLNVGERLENRRIGLRRHLGVLELIANDPITCREAEAVDQRSVLIVRFLVGEIVECVEDYRFDVDGVKQIAPKEAT